MFDPAFNHFLVVVNVLVFGGVCAQVRAHMHVGAVAITGLRGHRGVPGPRVQACKGAWPALRPVPGEGGVGARRRSSSKTQARRRDQCGGRGGKTPIREARRTHAPAHARASENMYRGVYVCVHMVVRRE